MANRVVATLNIACWKEHECCSCGTTYRYLFRRRKKGIGSNEEQARAMATRAAVKTVQRQVEPQPCPTCGLYQPDMVGAWRRRWHLILACGSALLFAIMFALMFDHNVSNDVPLWGAVVVGGVAVLGHLLTAARRFNQDRDFNRHRAQEAVEKGRLQVTRAYAQSGEDHQDAFRQVTALPIFLLMILATIAIPAADFVRRSQDWPWNSAWNPPVAGPGDQTTIRFPQKIQAVKGLWSGTATVHVENAAELGLRNDTIKAEASRDTWSNQIWIDDKDKDPNVLTSPWVRITIPDIAQPRGKTLRVQMELLVIYPSAHGAKNFETLERPFTHSANLVLAPPRTGALFMLLWWGAGVGGSVLVVITGLFLTLRANWLSARALPTRVFPLDQEHSGPDGLAPSLLVAASHMEVTKRKSDFFSPQEFSDEKLDRGARRTRIWLCTMILCMILGCSGILTAPMLFPGRQASDIPAIIGGCLFLVGLIGTFLMTLDLIRYRREQRARRSRDDSRKDEREFEDVDEDG
jgi:hypothetical protein